MNNLEKIIKENINYYQEKLADLNNKIYSLHQQTPDIWLKMMFDKFDFSSSERVSIYFFHEKQFHLLSRHSGNPNFKETHKPILKKDEGILHWIWSNGKAKDERCPSSKDIKKYIKHQQDNYKYDENRINEMTMKSCRYLGVRIDDNRDAKGLILVESLNEEFFTSEIHNENAIMEYIKKYQSYLTEFVNTGIAYQIERQKLNSNEGQNTPEKNMKEILGLK